MTALFYFEANLGAKENYLQGVQNRTKGPRVLFVSSAAVPTVSNTLTTLISYTLPAGWFANIGDRIEIEAETTQAADANTKLSAITFGSTVVASRGAADNNLARTLRATIIKTGAATQKATGTAETQGQGDVIVHSAPTENTLAAIAIALKGQNQTDTTAPSVTSVSMKVTYFPIGSGTYSAA